MADETLNANDGTLNVRAGSLGGTSMRYHELALQRWLNQLFYVREGYPVPVVFTSPMDAFSYFQQLWSDANNPFSYLFNLKDANGTPLYEPHPSPVRYPVISVYRKGWKLRPYQNFSIHRWRHINWPTVANAGTERYGPNAQGWDITKCQLGNVTTSRMPMAWNYRFQIDHFCNRPDTQAFFVEQLMQEFWRTGGTEPQTWLSVPYPGWGNRRVRLYLDGDIENLTPEEPEDGKNVEYRTSFTIVVEGFDVDLRYEQYPALWNLVFRFGPVAPIELEDCFNFNKTVDLRINGSNPSIDLRPNIPTSGTCQDVLWDQGAVEQTDIIIQPIAVGSDVFFRNQAQNHFGVFTIGTTIPTFLVTGFVTENGTGMSSVPVVFDTEGTQFSTAYTDTAGSYGGNVPFQWNGTVTPVWFGGDFSPAFRVYTLLGTHQYDQNFAFTGTTPPSYIISGSVTSNGSGISTPIAFDGYGTVYSDAQTGSYGMAVEYLWSGTARPVFDGGIFDPVQREYIQVMADIPNQDYEFFGAAVEVYGTDSGSVYGTFVYGSADLYVYSTAGGGAVSFASGTLLDASVHAGTFYGTAVSTTTFFSGTLADTIVYVFGTDYGTVATSFYEGTLFDTSVSTGSIIDSGSASSVFVNGTLTTLMLAVYDSGSGSTTVSFLSGTLA